MYGYVLILCLLVTAHIVSIIIIFKSYTCIITVTDKFVNNDGEYLVEEYGETCMCSGEVYDKLECGKTYIVKIKLGVIYKILGGE